MRDLSEPRTTQWTEDVEDPGHGGRTTPAGNPNLPLVRKVADQGRRQPSPNALDLEGARVIEACKHLTGSKLPRSRSC